MAYKFNIVENSVILLLPILLTLEIYSNTSIDVNISKSYSFNSISISNNAIKFYPSYGGISVINNGEVFHAWSPEIVYALLYQNIDESQIYTEWLMYKKNIFYFHYGVRYIKESYGLSIQLNDLGKLDSDTLPKNYADVFGVYLERCEYAVNPTIIGVPYLTTFNVLLANNCFVSMYFDWDKTNASQIIPYNSIYSSSSVYYSQYAIYNSLTNGKRNKLDEKIYLKVSENIDNVLPDLPNPVSQYKEESSNRIVFDDGGSFDKSISKITDIKKGGIDNIWHIVHNWQRFGYDVALPDVFPANTLYGGNAGLIQLGNLDKKFGYLFAVHENYIDIFKASTAFKPENLALNPSSKFIFNWLQPETRDTSFLVKPSKLFSILNPISNEIHQTFTTNSAYHDVSASYDPSKYVDYDYNVEDAGKFVGPFKIFKDIADTLRRIHNGPVSSEGLAHFLYVGYYDDICAQIHTAQSLPGSYGTENLGGFYKPLFVDFDLLKMKEKATVHGVGYYERFFYRDNYWQYMGRSNDSALMYSATELAYGHAAFFSTNSYNFIEQGLIEYNYVYPVQLRYANSNVSKILYNDMGILLSCSEYIKKHPHTFDKIDNEDFMSQVYIEYENGLKIYVNRNPFKEWVVDYNEIYGFYSSHYISGGNDGFLKGFANGKKFILPSNNGWLCYSQK